MEDRKDPSIQTALRVSVCNVIPRIYYFDLDIQATEVMCSAPYSSFSSVVSTHRASVVGFSVFFFFHILSIRMPTP